MSKTFSTFPRLIALWGSASVFTTFVNVALTLHSPLNFLSLVKTPTMLKDPVYLVPFDFTAMTESALHTAMRLAEAANGSVYLLHVVKKEIEKLEAERNLEIFVRKMPFDQRKRIVAKVLTGNLYEEVSRAADILNVRLNILGTHGAQGLQRIFGSNALKMVSKAKSPFLVAVSEQPIEKIETIVMPFSFVKESLQVLHSVCDVAKEFGSIIHLVGYHDKDAWLHDQSVENQTIAKKVLKDKGVPCEIVNLPRLKSYEDELSDYMYSVHTDLIAASYFKNGILPPPNSFVQVMIDNDHEIPVLTINGDQVIYDLEYA